MQQQKKRKSKKVVRQRLTSIICLLLILVMVLSIFLPNIRASAATPAIIFMDNNKDSYAIGETITFGVKLPAEVSSYDFVMGYNSATLKFDTDYPENKVHVDGNYFSITGTVIGDGVLYFKVSNVNANNGYPYGGASILRSAGTGEEPDVSNCLLSNMTVDNGELSPTFDKYVDTYWVDIKDKDTLTVTAEAENAGDTITYSQNGETVESNEFKIEKAMETVDINVSSGDVKKTYTIFVNHEVSEDPAPDTEDPTPEKPSEPEPENPNQTPEDPSEPTEKKTMNPLMMVGIGLGAFLIIGLIVLYQIKASKKVYDQSDEAFRKREEKERKKRVEQMRMERAKDIPNPKDKKRKWKK